MDAGTASSILPCKATAILLGWVGGLQGHVEFGLRHVLFRNFNVFLFWCQAPNLQPQDQHQQDGMTKSSPMVVLFA